VNGCEELYRDSSTESLTQYCPGCGKVYFIRNPKQTRVLLSHFYRRAKFSGDASGNVSGDASGNVSGDVSGDVKSDFSNQENPY